MDKIGFYSEGQKIEGTLVLPANLQTKNPGVIFFHGMTSNEKRHIPIAEKLAEHGIVGMTLSIRGHGVSEGNFNKLTVNDAIKDGLNAYDFFAQHDFIDLERIGIFGASLGAAIASMVSAKRDVKSLALRAPAAYTNDMMKMTFGQLMTSEGQIFQKMTNINNTQAIQAIAKFRGNLLVIASENDLIIPATIPTEYLLNAKSSAQKDFVVIKDANHGLTEDKWIKELTEKLIEWFTATL